MAIKNLQPRITSDRNILKSDQTSRSIRPGNRSVLTNVTQVGPGNINLGVDRADYDFNLSTGSQTFVRALRRRLPTYDNKEVEQIANLLLGQIGEHLAAGEQIAFFRRNRDGTTGLTTISIERGE